MADRLICLAAAVLFSAHAIAEKLPDPTRPPASIFTPVVAGGAEAAPVSLQSIIISRNRRAAIIGGETVELGGKYGDAKLIEVNEGSIVLRSTQGLRVMTLFPDVKMTMDRAPAGNEEWKVKARLQTQEGSTSPGERKARPAGGEKK